MSRVLAYEIDPQDLRVIAIPNGSWFLTLRYVTNKIVLWYLVPDLKSELVECSFKVVLDAEEFELDSSYLGSVDYKDRVLVDVYSTTHHVFGPTRVDRKI